MNLLKTFSEKKTMQEWIAQTEKLERQLIIGLSDSAKMLAMASLYQEKGGQVLIVTANLYQANQLVEDLLNVLSEEEVFLFSVDEMISVEMAFSSPEAMAERVRTLSALNSKKAGVYVTPLAGLRKTLPSSSIWQSFESHLKLADEIDLQAMKEKLVFMGYERQGMVGRPGEFSLRGSILDIYPLTSPHPIRIDLFDVEVDSLRYFEIETQRSIKELQEVVIPPAKDLLVTAENLKLAAEKLNANLAKQLAVTQDESAQEELKNYFEPIISDWQKGDPHQDAMKYFTDYLYQEKYSILNYLTPTAHLIVDDFNRISETERQIKLEEGEWLTNRLELNQGFSNQTFGLDVRALLSQAQHPVTYFSLFHKGLGNLKFQAVHSVQHRPMQQFFGQLSLLKIEMDRWQKQDYTVVVLVSDEEKTIRAEKNFREQQINIVVNNEASILAEKAQLTIGRLAQGFELPTEKLVVITESELSQKPIKKRTRRQTISNAERLKSYNELKAGDYVVHVNHGIGQYIGMETLQSDGVHQDYMTILYRNNDKLFIPVTQLDLIQKYVASEAKRPRINKLGGSEWSRTKRKVSETVEDIADDLIALYAAREAEEGFAFSPDDDYQREFEDAFPYSETDDQLRSVKEIKQDMEAKKPMDRLLVGDVGYGKTEVALRAAFKAIQDGKQVAFLVPTTILAQQHYETMEQRFADFPIEIGLLSRFRTRKEQQATLIGLAKGQVDIVTGTHRLLSQDVKFQDLGLLIVDEEQRFGVKHKERLKQLKEQVDVLTLTATPIPRTLHMSMLGVRDLSVIETPPANRYPVQTYVMEQNPGAIRDGIEREIARGGQVFFLHNRVETMTRRVEELKQLLPTAEIGFAHGQMSEVELENILYDFIHGLYDVLVTTTIIETGVDIPNVNTLFVENADYMGLSQLYQLRGRVGRSNRVAFAYFMYQPQKILTEVSEKRLQAIKDFTELGSGFKIAMRDLSIRGAGNILGAQQHGFIDSVGFDLYSQMLEEAVERKQGRDKQTLKTSVTIDVGIDAYLPTSYIADERQKIEIYKRVRQLENQLEADELEEDLLDRFGEYPDEVAYLLAIGQIKMNADYSLVEDIRLEIKNKQQDELKILLSQVGTKTYTVEQLLKALSETEFSAELGLEDEKMLIRLTIPKKSRTEMWLLELNKVLTVLRAEKKSKEGEVNEIR